MSDIQQIFFRVELGIGEAVQILGERLGFTVREFDGSWSVYKHGYGGLDRSIGGAVEMNEYSYPSPRPDEERSVYDGYPYCWEIWASVPGTSTRQFPLARRIFDDFVEKVGWPAVLTTNIEIVHVRWSPERGLEEFPLNTSTSVDSIDAWGAGQA